jgi:hypothetical protein
MVSEGANMNKEQAIQIIQFECDEMDGFLIKLHAKREFDTGQFQKLADALQSYRDATLGEECISRRVAGCLFYLVEILGSMASYFEHNNLPEKQDVTNAHSTIWNLIDSLYAA